MKHRRVWLMAGISAVILAIATSVQGQPSDQTLNTLARIRETNTIRIGHRLSSLPFSYLEEGSQQPIGYSIDLCRKIADAVQRALQLPNLEIEYILVDTQTRIPLLINGTIDLECGSTTNNLTRQEEVDFTHITFITGARLLVKSNSNINSLADLSGKSIGVSPNTTTEKIITEVIRQEQINATIYNQIRDHDEGFAALEGGLIDAFTTDDILLFSLVNQSRNPTDFQVVGDFLSYDPYGIMLRRNDADFRLVANRTLSELFRSGEIEEIYARWFLPLGVPMNPALKDAFRLQALPQ